MANLIVFENDMERAMLSAGVEHDWENQKCLFGIETKKLLDTCDKLFHAAVRFKSGDEDKLLRKIYGIAKAHGVHIKWYGMSKSACEPDRFLVSGYGAERLAFIQC